MSTTLADEVRTLTGDAPTRRGQKMSLISAGFPAFRPRGPNTVHATFSENLRLKLLAARIIWKGRRQ